MADLADRLKETRLARGLTQAQLADEIRRQHPEAKITQQNIGAIEKRRHRGTRYIAEIADVLLVHTDWLALEKGPRDRRSQGLVVDDPKLVAALKLMQPMAEYQKDQALKILDTLSQPPSALSDDQKRRTGNEG